MINCSEAKKISLVSILDKIGAKKFKQNNREVWYISPFRNETTASFKIDLLKNIWFDHGAGKGGNVLDFIMAFYKCDLKDVLRILDNESFSFHQPIFQDVVIEKEKSYKIKTIKHLTNTQLINYIQSRGISHKIAKKYCVEIHYSLNDKTYYGIGFKNDSGGYEIRNKYFKGCLAKKGITTIENRSNQVILFEGWIDFLSLLIFYPTLEFSCDFIILNSTSQRELVCDLRNKYNKIYLCFDNDTTGNDTTLYFKNRYYSITKDIRFLFYGYKDLSELVAAKNNSNDSIL